MSSRVPDHSAEAEPVSRRGWWRRLTERWRRSPESVVDQPSPQASKDPFHGTVFPCEMAYVRNRRLVIDDSRDNAGLDSPVSVDNKLIGLALSGGGIRSATFGLGILQALDRKGLFKFIDYISTVSGGGFLGSSLSVLMSQKARDSGGKDSKSEFPFKFADAADEGATLSYLRNNANYLAPRGPLDYLRVFAVLVRGIILNFLVLLPLLLICSMFVTLFYGQTLLDRIQDDKNQQRVAQLLERDWVGLAGSSSVQELLEALEAQSLIDDHRGRRREDVVQWLKGEVDRRQGVRSDTLPPLIRGSGEDYSKYSFQESATMDTLVARLWRSGLLRDLGALREVDAVEATVRASQTWIPSSLRASEDTGLSLPNLYETLEAEGLLGSEPEPDGSKPVPWTEFRDALEAGGLADCTRESPLDCKLTGQKPRLRRILQYLYEHGLYDPKWLDQATRTSPFAPPLAYWKPNELGHLEKVLTSQATKPLTQPDDLFNEMHRLKMLGVERSGFLDALGAKTVQAVVLILPSGFTTPLETVRVADASDLHEKLHKLWDQGALSRTWFDQNFSDHQPAYIGQLEKMKYGRDEGTAPTAVRAPLPATRYLLRVGLLWIVLYPLFLTFRWALRLLDSGARWATTGLTSLLLLAAGLLGYVILFIENTAALFSAPSSWIAKLAAWISELAPFPGRPMVNRMAFLVAALLLLLALGYLVSIAAGDLRRLALGAKAAQWRDRYERSFSLVLILIAVAAVIEIQPYLIYHYQQLQAGHVWWSLGIGAASLLATMVAGPAIAAFKKFGKSFVLAVVALLGPMLPGLVYVHLVLFVISTPLFYDSVSYRLDEGQLALSFIGLAILIHLLNLPIDVNSTSLHGFYRDRLSRAYLIREEGDEAVPEDDLSLAKICAEGSGAPYHLINTTLNLQGARDARLRRRRGDFFQFSRDFVGSRRTGYCATPDLEKVFPHLRVSSAMAVSAAAAAPNMGTFTSGPLVVLMALLNIRLGYWLPNPLRVNRWLPALGKVQSGALQRLGIFAASLVGSFRARPGAYLLVKEMLSLMHGDSRLVNLSDGGHMENTGAFQLLRRRCQFIIVSDAESDPELRFGGLASLIRYARIDLGIEIEIHTDDVRLDSEGESRQHCALGTIHYPPTGTQSRATPDGAMRGEVGYLLYIKSSVTGDENELISEYRRRSPTFPHESTTDQFFDEGQFEAYRDLGYHIASDLFDEWRRPLDSFHDCAEWFQSLTVALSPGIVDKVPFSDIQRELGNVERMLREPRYKDYFYELYPELLPIDHETAVKTPEGEAESFREVFHLVNVQLQLMESVFASSELGQKAHREHPANRGWMNLFRRWAKAPSFRRAYLASITTFSAPFQQFCQTALGLKLEFSWLVLDEAKRLELAATADELGLEILALDVPRGGQTLALSAAAPGTESILVGLAILASPGEHSKIHNFEMRAGYQGAGMRARAVLALQLWMDDEDRTFDLSEAAAVATQADEFDFDRSPGEDEG